MGQDIKKKLKKVWKFIWESDSPWSWILNIILAFVIIKFIIYPGLGLVLGTNLPVVAVISGSMEHNGNTLNEWWDSECCKDALCMKTVSQKSFYTPYNISKSDFESFRFKNGFNKGDIMFLISPKNAEVGDVIVFNGNHRNDPIIHRVIDMNSTSFRTKGDNNCGSWYFEDDIPKENVLGKAVLRVPLLGWIKIGFVSLIRLIGIGG